MKPQTRLQKKTGIANTRSITSKEKSTDTKVINKRSKETEHEKNDEKKMEGNENKKPGWMNIKDVEEKLVELEKQYKRAKDSKTKKKLSTLIDTYEKQAKALNLVTVQKKYKRTSKDQENIYTILEEEEKDEDEDSVSVMSDITMKTVNSMHKSPIKETSLSKSREKVTKHSDKNMHKYNEASNEKETKTAPVLESLGKTRKYRNKDSTKNTSNVNKITQDDATIMSNLTENKEDEIDKINTNTIKAISNMSKDDDGETIMSKCSTIKCIITKTDNNKETKKVNEIQDTKSQTEEENDSKKIEEQQEDTEELNEENTIMSETTILDQPKPTERIEEKEKSGFLVTQTPEKPTKVENPYTKRKTTSTKDKNKDNQKEDYASVTKKKMENDNKVSYNSNNYKNTNKISEIRIRFSFIGQNKGLTKKTTIKQILYNTMRCAKIIDPRVALMTWSENDNLSNLNGDELKMIPQICHL